MGGVWVVGYLVRVCSFLVVFFKVWLEKERI